MKLVMRDFSHLPSPVLAARLCHRIKNYDKSIGKFSYRNDLYKINPQGFYNLSISSNAEICKSGSGIVGGAVSTATVEKVSPSLKNTLK